MKKSLFVLLSIFVTTQAFAKLCVVVSIQPQMEFVQKVGGEKIDTTLMVLPGKSPHTYEPKPSQMKVIGEADLYLAMDVEFEKVWLQKFHNQNSKMVIKNIAKDINKSAMQGVHHHDKSKRHEPKQISLDPHIWVDPINVRTIAQNICDALVEVDATNSDYYQTNLKEYLKSLDTLDREIKKILSDTPKDGSFMVFHPAWGYFAKRYGLHQLAIEVEGKTPKMKSLIKIMEIAKKEHVQAIFTQPEFSDKSAQIIAKNLDIKVIKTSPLAENWRENLINLAKAIAEGNR
jgi:zinc transport system substrate-binding protein